MQAIEISKIDYEPSDMDILYAEGITLSNSITSMEFSFPASRGEDSLDPDYQHDPSLRSALISFSFLCENALLFDLSLNVLNFQ